MDLLFVGFTTLFEAAHEKRNFKTLKQSLVVTVVWFNLLNTHLS